MRDPNRIQEVSMNFMELWTYYPDMRFWQMASFLEYKMKEAWPSYSVFDAEDWMWKNLFEELIEKRKEEVYNAEKSLKGESNESSS